MFGRKELEPLVKFLAQEIRFVFAECGPVLGGLASLAKVPAHAAIIVQATPSLFAALTKCVAWFESCVAELVESDIRVLADVLRHGLRLLEACVKALAESQVRFSACACGCVRLCIRVCDRLVFVFFCRITRTRGRCFRQVCSCSLACSMYHARV